MRQPDVSQQEHTSGTRYSVWHRMLGTAPGWNTKFFRESRASSAAHLAQDLFNPQTNIPHTPEWGFPDFLCPCINLIFVAEETLTYGMILLVYYVQGNFLQSNNLMWRDISVNLIHCKYENLKCMKDPSCLLQVRSYFFSLFDDNIVLTTVITWHGDITKKKCGR